MKNKIALALLTTVALTAGPALSQTQQPIKPLPGQAGAGATTQGGASGSTTTTTPDAGASGQAGASGGASGGATTGGTTTQDQTGAGTSTQGQAGASGGAAAGGAEAGTEVNVTAEQQTEIRQAVTEVNVQPVTSIDIDINIGVVIPATIELHPLPARVIQIVPQYEGYLFFLLPDGRIVIVQPTTLKIVFIIAA